MNTATMYKHEAAKCMDKKWAPAIGYSGSYCTRSNISQGRYGKISSSYVYRVEGALETGRLNCLWVAYVCHRQMSAGWG